MFMGIFTMALLRALRALYALCSAFSWSSCVHAAHSAAHDRDVRLFPLSLGHLRRRESLQKSHGIAYS